MKQYYAFISYSSKDAEWAKWLLHKLENYRVPRSIRKSFPSLPKSLFPIFRDREELSASADLGAQIKQALEASKYLIVICSPKAAQSKWVNEEIRIFQDIADNTRIKLLIVDGEPNAADSSQNCIPYALDTEPLCGDARDENDGKKDAFLKIVSGLLNIPFDDIKKREVVRKRRRLVISLISIISILSIIGIQAYQTQDVTIQNATLEKENVEVKQANEQFIYENETLKENDTVEQRYYESGLPIHSYFDHSFIGIVDSQALFLTLMGSSVENAELFPGILEYSYRGNTILHYSSSVKYKENLFSDIISENNNSRFINRQNNEGFTALHMAAFHGRKGNVIALINTEETDLFITDHEGRTFLEHALNSPNENLCYDLIQYFDSTLSEEQFDSLIIKLHNESTIGIVQSVVIQKDIKTLGYLHNRIPSLFDNCSDALSYAAGLGDMEIVRNLMSFELPIMDSSINGVPTVIENAVYNNQIEVVKFLVDSADMIPQDSLVFLAVENTLIELTSFFLEDCQLHPESYGSDSSSLLHRAINIPTIEDINLKLVQFLIAYDSSLLVSENSRGETPYEIVSDTLIEYDRESYQNGSYEILLSMVSPEQDEQETIDE